MSDYVREAINALDATPWRINRRVFEEVCRAWQEQDDIRKMPKREPLDKLRKKCDALSWTPHARAEAKAALKRRKWTDEDKGRWQDAWKQADETLPRPAAKDKDAWRKRDEQVKGLFVRSDTDHAEGDARKWDYQMVCGAYYRYKADGPGDTSWSRVS